MNDYERLVILMAIEAVKPGYEHGWITRAEILSGKGMPPEADVATRVKIMFAALTVSKDIFEWSAGGMKFRLTRSFFNECVRRGKV